MALSGWCKAGSARGSADGRANCRGHGARQALWRFCRARQHQHDRRRRRAARPDRTQWLGQEHARQLPFRNAASRQRQYPVRRPADRRHAGLPPDPARARAQFSTAEAVQKPQPCRQSTHSAALCRQCPARGTDLRCRALLADVGLADKALYLPRDLTQVEMRKLELARAVASAPRLLFADEAMAGLSPSEVEEILVVLFRLNEAGITIVLIEHIMRAVMSFSTRLVVLVAGQKVADGAPQKAIRNPEVERAYLGE